MSFPQAIQLNNEGVASLVIGREDMAITSLAQSIKILKQELSDRCESSSFNASSSSIWSHSDSSINESITNDSNLPQDIQTTVKLPERQEQQQSFIFNEAIAIPSPTCEEEIYTDQDVRIYTGAVIFNLALSYHLKANHESLLRADKLYSMVLKLLVDDSASRISVLAKLASINNLTQIRFESGNFMSVADGLDHLVHFMRGFSATADTSSPFASHPMFQEPQIKGLLTNVLLLEVPKAAPAA